MRASNGYISRETDVRRTVPDYPAGYASGHGTSCERRWSACGLLITLQTPHLHSVRRIYDGCKRSVLGFVLVALRMQSNPPDMCSQRDPARQAGGNFSGTICAGF